MPLGVLDAERKSLIFTFQTVPAIRPGLSLTKPLQLGAKDHRGVNVALLNTPK